MDVIRPDHSEAPMGAERVLQQAMTYSMMMRRVFHEALTCRCDDDEWKLLETATGGISEQNGRYRDAEWYVGASKRLRQSATSLFRNRSPKSSRVGCYRRSVDHVYESIAAWGQELDEWTVAYWRHSALVWITLWHLADVPDVTATHAKECLDYASTEALADAHELPLQPTKLRWSLSEAASSLVGAFRKAG